LTVYQTLAGDSPIHMVPHIRTILGGFLFSGDDIEKPVRVLSGGERTRLAVARMLLRPANTLLLDEPTNHLDLDSKDVLLEALEDFGGTLIFVSHDRYFVDKLATKVIDIGRGEAIVYPGTYEEWLWSKKARQEAAADARKPAPEARKPAAGAAADGRKPAPDLRARRDTQSSAGRSPAAADRPSPSRPGPVVAQRAPPPASYEDKKKADAEARRIKKEEEARQRRITELEGRIAAAEAGIKELEAAMSAPGFYENHETSRPIIDRHQALMWEVGDLMNKWEALQSNTKT
jgi:ATP-binding cassette subfamily F protein 3